MLTSQPKSYRTDNGPEHDSHAARSGLDASKYHHHGGLVRFRLVAARCIDACLHSIWSEARFASGATCHVQGGLRPADKREIYQQWFGNTLEWQQHDTSSPDIVSSDPNGLRDETERVRQDRETLDRERAEFNAEKQAYEQKRREDA